MGRLVFGGAVPFDELVGSPTFKAGRESRSLVRKGRISWANIDAAILECFPPPPFLWGAHPTSAYLFVESLEIEPFHNDMSNWLVCTGDCASYTAPGGAGYEAVATVTYALLPNPEADQLISVKVNVAGDMQELAPNGNLLYADNNEKIQEPDARIGKFIPVIEYALSRQRVASIPWTAIRDCIGKVNSATLNTFPFSNVGAETMLYAGAEIAYSRDTLGNSQYSLDMRFHERLVSHPNIISPPGGWNHIYRAADNKWVKIKDKNGNKVGYDTSANFLTLFS
jgi:hypothetical protein